MLLRFWNLFRRRRLEREMDLEFRHHLELLEAENRARGLLPDEARQAALRDFGSLTQVQEAYRDQRGIPMLETLLRDVRFSLRSMWRTPVLTFAVIATLAIGIGANTTIFSVVNAVLLKPLPYPNPDRLIVMSHTAPGVNVADVASAPFLYFTEREQNRTLEGIGLFANGSGTITGLGEPEVVRRLWVTADVLPMLGIQPLLGRYFTPQDDTPESPQVLVLTHGYWQRRFGGDSTTVGRKINMDGQSWDVIGVMPQEFNFLDKPVDVITPQRLDRNRVMLGGYFRSSIARLKPGVTLQEASADVARMIPIAIDSFPPGPGSTREQIVRSRLAPRLSPLKQAVVGDAGNALWVIMGTLSMMLMIACANVANLILVRTEGRRHELSIRAALGAGWGRIARQLLTESTVLSLIGGFLGVGFAYGGLRLLLAMAPANLPRRGEITIDFSVLLFAFFLSALCGLLFGALPVLRYRRRQRLATWPAATRWASENRDKQRARAVLVIGQVALALVLLIGAGLMIRTFQELNGVSPGFNEPGEVQTFQIMIPQTAVPDPEPTVRRQQEILDRIAALPGVSSAAYMSDVPMSGGVGADLIVPEGKIFREGESPRSTQSRFVSPGVFSSLRVPLVNGRDLTWTDIYEKRPVVLVSENLARLDWGSPEEALGKRLRGSSTADQWREIVGVVGDVHDRGLNQPAPATVYYPVMGERVYNYPIYVWRSVTYLIRSNRTGSPGMLDEIRQVVWSVDPNLPLTRVGTMEDLVKASMARTAFTLVMLALAGTMALLLGVIGIYGALSYGVSQRKREIGVRIALGAQRGEVQRMFLRQGLLMTAIGVVIGLGGAVALSRSMKSLLFEVSPLDPWTYAGVCVVLLFAASLASYVPSRRATRIDPIDSLRSE